MKILIVISLCIHILFSGSAQVNDLKIIASAGASNQVENLQLDWTLGETVILTLENSPVLLSQGFHQPTYDLISAVENPTWSHDFNVFPNPCYDKINVYANFPVASSGYLEIFDMAGKCLEKKSFTGLILNKQYDISCLPQGQYTIVLLVPAYHDKQSISMIKL
jgi:hypothetical protein